MEELHKETNKPFWGGFASVPLDVLPEGIVVPDDLNMTIRYDRSLECVTAYDVVTTGIRDRLIRATPRAAWHREVDRGRGLSRRATALFMGGGGFIFPRWFLKEFPGSPRVEVAELDAAVYQVSIDALGMTDAEQERILTSIGDARNFVDDRLRDNRRLVAAGKPPVKYDFIYGDAFSDFSIPAHLTTREFLVRVHDLLNEDGVFQANIIDIYPRAEYPGTTLGIGEVDFKGPLPKGLSGLALTFGRYESAGPRFAPLEIKGYNNGDYRLQATQTISPIDEARLINVDLADEPKTKNVTPMESEIPNWSAVISDLANQTRQRMPFEGSIPESLKATDGPLEAWTPATSPWECVEVCRLGSRNGGQESRHVLGLRGIVSHETENQLVGLDPNNQAWVKAVRTAAQTTRQPGAGRFLGRYVATAAKVFPNIYVFSTSIPQPGASRDTFVMVCSRRPLDLRGLADTGDWTGDWFAAMETKPGQSSPTLTGQMAAVLTLAEGQVLTDDFAPVDNLLRPVFADQ